MNLNAGFTVSFVRSHRAELDLILDGHLSSQLLTSIRNVDDYAVFFFKHSADEPHTFTVMHQVDFFGFS